MNYELTRVMMSIGITALAFIFIHRILKIKHKFVLFFLVILFFVLELPLSQIVFENEIFDFRTPVEASEYYEHDDDIIDVIEEGHIALVTCEKAGANIFYLEDGKWKIPGKVFAHPYVSTILENNGLSIQLWGIPELNEYMVFVTESFIDCQDGVMEITDESGAKYRQEYNWIEDDQYYISHYAVFHGNINEYWLTVDGRRFRLMDSEAIF